jgi:hypothetical protein
VSLSLEETIIKGIAGKTIDKPMELRDVALKAGLSMVKFNKILRGGDAKVSELYAIALASGVDVKEITDAVMTVTSGDSGDGEGGQASGN